VNVDRNKHVKLHTPAACPEANARRRKKTVAALTKIAEAGQPASGIVLDRRAGRTHSVEKGSPARLRLELS
jgi:hypothetical protein